MRQSTDASPSSSLAVCVLTCASSASGCPSTTESRSPADWQDRTSQIHLPSSSSPRWDMDEYVHGALKTGARGFLLKDAGPELLAQAVRAAGDALIAPSVTARLLSEFSELGATTSEPAEQPIDPLTEREEEVLVTVARGRTNAEIADDLHISLSTVKTHLASLMSKLGARNRVELAMWAYETDRMPTN